MAAVDSKNSLPVIKLTDSHNQEHEPTRPFSPTRDAPASPLDASLKEERGRPQTPTRAKQSKDRPSSDGARASPGGLVKGKGSSNASPASQTRRESTNGPHEGSQSQQYGGFDPLTQVGSLFRLELT